MDHYYVDTASDGGDGTTREETGAGGAEAFAYLESALSSLEGTLFGDMSIHYAGGSDTTAATYSSAWSPGSYHCYILGDRGDDHSGEGGDDGAAFDGDGWYGGKNNWSTSHVRLEPTINGAALLINGDGCVVDGLQVDNKATNGFIESIAFNFGSANDFTVTVQKNRVRMSNAPTGGVCIGDDNANSIQNDGTYNVYANLVFSGENGISIKSANFRSPTANIIGNTVYGMDDYCIDIADGASSTGVWTLINNACANGGNGTINDNVNNGTSTYNKNAVDDSLGTTNEIDISGTETDYWDSPGESDSGSFYPVSSGALVDAGATSGLATDIRDVSRGGTYDAGCFEYESSGATGTGSQTLPSVTQAASGALQPEGTAAQALPAIGQAASGTLTIAGAISQTVPAQQQAAAGTLTITGTAQQTLAPPEQAAAGFEALTGTAAQDLAALTQAATGAETFTGSAAQDLPALEQAASGTHASSTTSGAAAQDLPALQQAAAGLADIVGAAAQELPALTQSAAAVEIITGAAAQAMAAFVQAGAGDLVVEGVGSQVLAALLQAASGAETVAGATAQTLPALTQAAGGTHVVEVTGTGAQVIAALVQSGAGTVAAAVIGNAAQTLPALVQLGAVTIELPDETLTFLDHVAADFPAFFALAGDQLETDLAEVFMATTDGFAVIASHATAGTFSGIFDDQALAEPGADVDQASLLSATSEVAGINRGDTVTIDGTDYQVSGRGPDGVGLTRLWFQR